MNKLKKIVGLFRSFLLISALALSTTYSKAVSYDDEGTEYSNASGASWIEDASKQALQMVNAFVCIIKNSNGNTRPNGTWRILIDEVACDLNHDDSVAWADAVSVSTRASNTSDQEIVTYFNSADGGKYVANTTLNENASSAFDLTMLFKWYQANDIYDEGGEDLTDSGWVDGAGNAFGFSEIKVENYDDDLIEDTVIRTAEMYGGSTEFGGIAVTYGGTPSGASTAFLVSMPNWDTGEPDIYSGAISETEYLRRTYDSSTETFGSDTCYQMENPYQTVYRYGVYDSTTGAELEIDGSFGFTYEEGASGGSGRGYMGHWGSWFENRDDKLTLTNTSLNITPEGSSASMTLNWAPGKMWLKESSTENIVNGEKFEVTDWSNGSRENVVWNTDDFYDSSGAAYTFADSSSISEGDWIFSERFDTWVGFLGANNAGVYQLFVEQNTQVRGHWDATNAINVSEEVEFICAGNCPNTAISYDDYSTWAYTDEANNSGDTYILTPYDEARAGIFPLSLYKDSVAAGNLVALNANDEGYADAMHAHIWTGDYILSSENGEGTCAADTDPDAANNIYNCEYIFAWESGLREWGQYTFPTDADGPVEIQDPINFEYTHAAINDRNNANYADSDSPFIYNWIQTDWSQSPPTSTQVDDQETYVSKFDGMKINLKYEGVGELWGFPERETDNGWLKLVNLVDGTQITKVSDGSTYVVKMRDSGLLLNQTECSRDLEVPAEFEDLELIPAASSYTQPSQIFNNAPTVDDVHVKQGEDLIPPSQVQANS